MIIKKLQANLIESVVHYEHPYAAHSLNSWVNQKVLLEWTGLCVCAGCHKSQNKLIQGYCYLCSKRLACCDLCIVKPELCHYHLGTCREPEWGLAHCMQPHIIYLALTSHPKIGITRLTQLPTRWIDQGAVWAVPLARTYSRLHAGLLESTLAQEMSDQTAWRALLTGSIEQVTDRRALALQTQEKIHQLALQKSIPLELEPLSFTELVYPVTRFLSKAITHNLEKQPSLKDTLIGIKGQYMIFEHVGALNVRKYTGWDLTVELL